MEYSVVETELTFDEGGEGGRRRKDTFFAGSVEIEGFGELVHFG